MKTNRAILLALVPATLCAQERGMIASPPAWKGLEILFQARIETAGAPASNLPGGVVIPGDRVHRSFSDNANRRYFGYDLRVEPLGDGGSARIRIEPLNPPPKFTFDPGWTFIAPAEYPVIPKVQVGESIALDLLVNPATGQRVVDYLTLRHAGAARPAATKLARDFQLSDVEMLLQQPKVSINGRLLEGAAPFAGGVSGHVVALYIGDRGRYIFSLLPQPGLGFQKSGMVTRKEITFQAGNDEFRVECSNYIAPGSGVYNLYLFHDPVWRSDHPLEIHAAGKAEYLVRQR